MNQVKLSYPMLLTDEYIINSGQANKDMLDALKSFIERGLNVVVVGDYGVGKTQLLRYLSGYTKDSTPLVTVQRVEELELANYYPTKTVTSLLVGHHNKSMLELLYDAQKSSPVPIIVEGVQSQSEVDILIQLMRKGFPVLTSIYGSSVEEAITYLYTLHSRIDGFPEWLVGKSIADNIDIVIHQKRSSTGDRVITKIVELAGYTKEGFLYNTLFELDEIKPSQMEFQRDQELTGLHAHKGYLTDNLVSKLQRQVSDIQKYSLLIPPTGE